MPTLKGHNSWCARGHHCGLGEHRADPIAIDVPRLGRGVLTRVADADGRQYAEIMLRVALPVYEQQARVRLASLLTRLPMLIGGVR
jgi:hypothetical protein